MTTIRKSTYFWVGVLFFASIFIGCLLGYGLAETKNIKNSEYISSFDTALPTKLLDINGELITEFSSDEKMFICHRFILKVFIFVHQSE